MWGLDIGLTFTTYLTFAGPWLLLIVAVASANPTFAAVLFGDWIGRVLSLWLMPLLLVKPESVTLTQHGVLAAQNGGGALMETGWRDKTDASGNHYFRLFTESCFTSGCNVHEYSSGCATAGTTVTMIVKSASPGSNIWKYSYGCNGGGYTSLGDSGAEVASYASPRVETFRFGAPGSNLFILDHHNVLGHYDSYGNLFRNMGTLVCKLGMSGTYGVPKR